MNLTYTALEGEILDSVGIKTPTFEVSGPTSLLTTSTFIYSLLFTLIIVGAFYRYVIAGVYRMQASEFSIRKSNEIIKQVTLGLLGVFSLFLILFTINKGLVTGDVTLDDLKSRTPVGEENTSPDAPGGGSVLPPSPAAGAPSGTTIGDPLKEDPAVRAKLASMNITVNKSVCATLTSTGCTTVGGLPQGTLDMLQKLRSACPGSIVITGGTEAGHKSHGPTKTPVDLRIGDSTFDSCVAGFTKGPSVGSWCKRTFTNFGYIFCDEKSGEPHWHVYK